MDNENEILQIFLKDLILFFKKHLNDNLLAVYLLGSLAHGGYSELTSDIDIGIILENHDDAFPNLINTFKVNTDGFHESFRKKASFFWIDFLALKAQTHFAAFPLIDRLDLLQYGKLIFGKELKKSIPYPSQSALLKDNATLFIHILKEKNILHFLKYPEELLHQNHIFISKLILYPVRVYYSLITNKIPISEEALDYLKSAWQNNQKESLKLITMAYEWRYNRFKDINHALSYIKKYLADIYKMCLTEFYDRLKRNLDHDLAVQIEYINEQI